MNKENEKRNDENEKFLVYTTPLLETCLGAVHTAHHSLRSVSELCTHHTIS